MRCTPKVRTTRFPLLVTLAALLCAFLVVPIAQDRPAALAQSAAALSAGLTPTAGEAPFYRFKTFKISDRAQLKVNLANGNLIYKQTDLAIAGTGVPLTIDRYYNSAATGAWDTGVGWQFNFGRDNRVYLISDTALLIRMPTGYVAYFTRPNTSSAWIPPRGLSTFVLGQVSCLWYCTWYDKWWKLTDRSTGTTFGFAPTGRFINSGASTDGHLSYVTDRHGSMYGGNGVFSGWSYPPPDYRPPCGTFDKLSNSRGSVSISRDPNQGCFVTKLADWSGRSVSYGYGSSGELNYFTDAANGLTVYGYNGNYNGNRLSQITSPGGKNTYISYDSLGRVFSIQLSDGAQWSFLYGRNWPVDGMIACQTGSPDPLLSSAVTDATYVVDPRSTRRPTSPTAAWGSFDFQGSAYCHDAYGAVLREMESDSGGTDYSYDANGNQTQVGWGSSRVTRGIDAAGRLISSTIATGAGTAFGYGDPVNSHYPTAVSTPQGGTHTFAYNSTGDLTTTTDPAAKQQTFTYNYDGTLATSTDQRQNTTAYGYTSGNLTSVDPPGTAIGTSTFTYDTLSRLMTARDGNGQTSTLSYDNLDRTTRVSYSDGSFVAYAYDRDGNLTRRDEGTGTTVAATTSYAYDARNHMCWQLSGSSTATCSSPPAGATRYTYDSLGRPASFTDAGGTVGYGYGVGGRLTSVTEPGGKVTRFGVSDRTAEPDHHPTTPPLVTYPNGVTITNTSDEADRLVRTRAVNAAGTVLMDLGYGYHTEPVDETNQGRDTSLVQNKTDYLTGSTTNYGYDTQDRMTSAYEYSSGGLANYWTYSYDASGNRISKTENGSTTGFTFNSVNELTAAGATIFSYDLNGNMVSSSAGFAGTYNAKNQTRSLTPPVGGAAQFAYYAGEGQSELTRLGANSYTNGALGISGESGKYVTRRSEEGGLVSIRSAGSNYYALQDLQGSVVALTDAGGNKATSFGYDPYGQRISATGSTSLSPFGFGGALYSPSLGLSLIGSSYASPVLGTVTQASAGSGLPPALGPAGPPFADVHGNPMRPRGPGGGSLCSLLRFLLEHPAGRHGFIGGAGMSGGTAFAQLLQVKSFLAALGLGVGAAGSLAGSLTAANLQRLYDKFCKWQPPPSGGVRVTQDGMDESDVADHLYPAALAAAAIAGAYANLKGRASMPGCA